MLDDRGAVGQPITEGWVGVSDGRHRKNATRSLTGAPEARCILTRADVVPAEYVYPDRASLEAAREERQRAWNLLGRRTTFEAVRVVITPTPAGTGPPGAHADRHDYAPPPRPTAASRQFGLLYADAGWQGVETTQPAPPPQGSENRWACVFLIAGTQVRAR